MLKVAGGGTGGGSTPGAVVYQGVWNASSNSPTLTSSVGTNGYYYVVSVAGSTNLNGITDWQVSDWAVFNGTIWQKIDNTDGVVSVNGKNGVVVLTSNDVGATANTTYVVAGTGLSGGGQLNANVTVNLANTTVSAGTYGNGTQVAQIAIDAQGRITSASNVSITTAGIGTVTSVATGTGLTGGPITTIGTISIANTAVTAGAYGNASTVGTFTVNGQGQLTATANAAISIPASAINTTIPNSGLTNSSVTINGTSISLGGSETITANTVGTLTLGTGLTGTSFNGSTAVTTNLANTAVVAGSYGNASTVGTFTVDAQGRLTAASNTAISIAVGSVSGAVPNTRLISTGTGLTGGGDLTADRTLSVTANSTQQLVGVQNNGTLAATRQIINFAPGNNAVIAVSDDSANNRANVTIGTSQAVTFTTSIASPLIIGGTGASSTLTLGSTSGTGTSDSVIVKTGSQVTALTVDTNQNATLVGNMAMGASFLRNRLINGNMYVTQRATSATVTAGTTVPTATTGYPCVDRWFVYSTGANVTAAQVAGTAPVKNLLRVTGAASVTAVGVGQRIEQLNSYDLAGQTCTLSVSIANSLLTTVTWTASYATTANAFGTIGTATKTQIATGTFTVTSTLTRYTTNISVPAAATTGIEILFTVGAQTSGTLDISEVQFEPGSIATPFERKLHQQQLIDCYRYYFKFQAGAIGDQFGSGGTTTTTSCGTFLSFPTPMWVAPTTIVTTGTATDYGIFSGNAVLTVCNAVPTFASATPYASRLGFTAASGLTALTPGFGRAATTAAYVAWPSEIP